MKKRTIKLNFNSTKSLLRQIFGESQTEELAFSLVFVFKLSQHLKAIKGHKGNENKVIEMLSNHLAQCNKFIVFTFLIER